MTDGQLRPAGSLEATAPRERPALFKYAFIAPFDQRIQQLADLAQPENWNYRRTIAPTSHSILRSYFKHTFARLQEQGKLLELGKEACFNTGLLDPDHDPIYAYLTPSRQAGMPEAPQWYLQRFCTGYHAALSRLSPLPPRATYFDNPADLLFDARIPLRTNTMHIVQENRERFPEPFRSMPDPYQVHVALNGALEQAKLRVEQNYKVAIPQFHRDPASGRGRLELLLPLCLLARNQADLALVVFKDGASYRASTVLTLDMAYNNARLVAKPDDEWLVP